jgi:cytoskeletal protein CcmA (bactofilin family)
MFGKRRKIPRIDSLVGATTRIDGAITFIGGLRVDGVIRGNITALEEKPSTLVLSEKGRVEGEIKVSRAIINGEVSGPVYATESVELMPRARVTGDVHYRSIEVHMGAVVSGKLVHELNQSNPKVVELKPYSSN